MNIDKRQQMLAIFAGVMVALLAGDRFVLTPLTTAWKNRSGDISELRAKLAKGEGLLSQRDRIESRWDGMRTNTLPLDSSAAEGLVLNSLRKWVEESGASSQAIKSQWKHDNDDYTLFECHVDATGGIESLAKLLYTVESSALALKVDLVDITSRDATGQQLTMSFQFTTLMLNPVQPQP